jgi:two-component system response regulator HydG
MLLRRCTLADLEREYVLLVLGWTEGKKTEAADLLGIDRKTLYRKLVEYGQET